LVGLGLKRWPEREDTVLVRGFVTGNGGKTPGPTLLDRIDGGGKRELDGVGSALPRSMVLLRSGVANVESSLSGNGVRRRPLMLVVLRWRRCWVGGLLTPA
jgi:hypothetical protein